MITARISRLQEDYREYADTSPMPSTGAGLHDLQYESNHMRSRSGSSLLFEAYQDMLDTMDAVFAQKEVEVEGTVNWDTIKQDLNL